MVLVTPNRLARSSAFVASSWPAPALFVSVVDVAFSPSVVVVSVATPVPNRAARALRFAISSSTLDACRPRA